MDKERNTSRLFYWLFSSLWSKQVALAESLLSLCCPPWLPLYRDSEYSVKPLPCLHRILYHILLENSPFSFFICGKRLLHFLGRVITADANYSALLWHWFIILLVPRRVLVEKFLLWHNFILCLIYRQKRCGSDFFRPWVEAMVIFDI